MLVLMLSPLYLASDLMKGSPELMTEALNLHNAVIRKARWTTFGYIVEQVVWTG